MAARLPLSGKVALVAGATRGVGRGVACMLGEAGAIVYCTGRSTRAAPYTAGYFAGRPETIDETAEMTTARGGVGIPVRVDHLVESEVEALVARIRADHGRLDVLVNDMSEGEAHEWRPFWEVSLDKGFRALRQGVNSHIVTSRYAAPLMIATGGGLIVEITDGVSLRHHGTLFYDLVKTAVNRLAWVMAEELYAHRVAVVALTPGFTRTEAMLDHMKVTEVNWREAAAHDPHFSESETPCFAGRAVAALAADPGVLTKSGGLYSSHMLAAEYGFTDLDGSQPNVWRRLDAVHAGDPGGGSKTGRLWTIVTTAPRTTAPRRRRRSRKT